MMNTLSYKGYAARVEFDPRDNIFWGKVFGITDGISFEGETVAELIDDFHNAIDHYIADCIKDGRQPQKPYSGKLTLRVPPEVHAYAAMMAETHGKSLNQWAADVLANAQ